MFTQSDVSTLFIMLVVLRNVAKILVSIMTISACMVLHRTEFSQFLRYSYNTNWIHAVCLTSVAVHICKTHTDTTVALGMFDRRISIADMVTVMFIEFSIQDQVKTVGCRCHVYVQIMQSLYSNKSFLDTIYENNKFPTNIVQ